MKNKRTYSKYLIIPSQILLFCFFVLPLAAQDYFELTEDIEGVVVGTGEKINLAQGEIFQMQDKGKGIFQFGEGKKIELKDKRYRRCSELKEGFEDYLKDKMNFVKRSDDFYHFDFNDIDDGTIRIYNEKERLVTLKTNRKYRRNRSSLKKPFRIVIPNIPSLVFHPEDFEKPPLAAKEKPEVETKTKAISLDTKVTSSKKEEGVGKAAEKKFLQAQKEVKESFSQLFWFSAIANALLLLLIPLAVFFLLKKNRKENAAGQKALAGRFKDLSNSLGEWTTRMEREQKKDASNNAGVSKEIEIKKPRKVDRPSPEEIRMKEEWRKINFPYVQFEKPIPLAQSATHFAKQMEHLISSVVMGFYEEEMFKYPNSKEVALLAKMINKYHANWPAKEDEYWRNIFNGIDEYQTLFDAKLVNEVKNFKEETTQVEQLTKAYYKEYLKGKINHTFILLEEMRRLGKFLPADLAVHSEVAEESAEIFQREITASQKMIEDLFEIKLYYVPIYEKLKDYSQFTESTDLEKVNPMYQEIKKVADATDEPFIIQICTYGMSSPYFDEKTIVKV